MLQANLTHRVTHVLTREGNPPKNPSLLLRHSNLFFWGDLDLMGMAIFDRLKRHFPQLKLSALYEPMIKELFAGRSHPYVGCVGKKGQKAQRLNDPMAQRLAALCRGRAVDQEIVYDGFDKLGMHPLPASALDGVESIS
nr:Wadjet anti-phage system protein JetD domain-containing protein [Pseudodesulfovibrio sp. S3-i]